MDNHDFAMMAKIDAEGPSTRKKLAMWFGHRTGPGGPRSTRGVDVVARLRGAGLIELRLAEDDRLVVDLTPAGRFRLGQERESREKAGAAA